VNQTLCAVAWGNLNITEEEKEDTPLGKRPAGVFLFQIKANA